MCWLVPKWTRTCSAYQFGISANCVILFLGLVSDAMIWLYVRFSTRRTYYFKCVLGHTGNPLPHARSTLYSCYTCGKPRG